MLLCLAAAAAVVCAADLSGKWTGTAEFVNRGGETRKGPMLITLKHTGDTITGTAGPTPERQFEVTKAKLEDDKLTFELVEGATQKTLVEVTVKGDEMTGEAKMQREYGVIPAKLSAKRGQ
jgi:hypothetical protein